MKLGIFGLGQLGSTVLSSSLRRGVPSFGFDARPDVYTLNLILDGKKDVYADCNFFSDEIQKYNFDIDTLIICGGDSPRDIAHIISNEDYVDKFLCGVEGLCSKFNSSRIIYLSSFSVYGKFDGHPCEESELSPVSIYGDVKKKIETQLFESEICANKLVVLRPCGTVGHRVKGRVSKSSEIIYDALRMTEQNDGMDIDIHSFNLGEIIWVYDLAKAVIDIACSPLLRYNAYNIGGGVELNSKELIQGLSEVFPTIKYREVGDFTAPQIGRLNLSRVSEEGFLPADRTMRFLIEYLQGM